MQTRTTLNNKFLKLQINIDHTKSRRLLINRVKEALSTRAFTRCKILNNRKVFFDKYLIINSGYRLTKPRLAAYSAGIELIQNAISVTTVNGKFKSYELKGISADGFMVTVHLREEIFQSKNRRLIYASSYYKNL